MFTRSLRRHLHWLPRQEQAYNLHRGNLGEVSSRDLRSNSNKNASSSVKITFGDVSPVFTPSLIRSNETWGLAESLLNLNFDTYEVPSVEAAKCLMEKRITMPMLFVTPTTEDEFLRCCEQGLPVRLLASCSDLFLEHKLKWGRCGMQQLNKQTLKWARMAGQNGLPVSIRVLCAFGCPYQGFLPAPLLTDLLVDFENVASADIVEYILVDTCAPRENRAVVIGMKTLLASGLPLDKITCEISNQNKAAAKLAHCAMSFGVKNFSVCTIGGGDARGTNVVDAVTLAETVLCSGKRVSFDWHKMKETLLSSSDVQEE